ncbi:MAG TPA: hypothetical protein VGN34_32395 [Ktedonobacteraceae bacterium]
MSTYENRLQLVEYGLNQFKIETIQAYQDSAMELTMLKGLTEDAVKRLLALKMQIDQRFNAVDQQIAEVRQDFSSQIAEVKQDFSSQIAEVKQGVTNLHQRFDRLEKLLLDRLPPLASD